MPMQLHVVRAERSFGAHDSARAKLVERRLRGFRPNVQPAVRRVARRHSRLADLAVSFPALLLALAVPRAGFNPEPVIAQVIAGAPLAELAQAADVALWLRKFTPEMLPRALPRLPDSHDFRRKIANHLPRTAKLAPAWLEAVANATSWCDESFAIWVARAMVQWGKPRVPYELRLVCLWAWFSARPDTLAYRLIEKPWTPFMQWTGAVDAANSWQVALDLYLEVGDEIIADTWTEPGTVDGYEFVPLRTFADITEEARAMRNCLRTYGYGLVHNHSRLWSVRKDGRRIATLEIASGRGDPLPCVCELRAAGNKNVPIDVAWAARRWLHMHDLPRVDTKSIDQELPLNREIWNALWKPYWLAKRRFPEWLPLAPSRAALRAL